jgi:hypothetical protein
MSSTPIFIGANYDMSTSPLNYNGDDMSKYLKVAHVMNKVNAGDKVVVTMGESGDLSIVPYSDEADQPDAQGRTRYTATIMPHTSCGCR